MDSRSDSGNPFRAHERTIFLYVGLFVVAVLAASCATLPFGEYKQEVQIRVYPHMVSSGGGINYHALCEIYERSWGKQIRSLSFNNATIQVDGYDFHLDEGFIETHRGEQYEDYIVDGRFLYNGAELVLDSRQEVRIRMAHPKIGNIERTLEVPMSVREARVDHDQLALWIAGDVTSLELQWAEEKADRYQILAIAVSHDGRTERTYFDTTLQEICIERSQLNLPPGFDFTAGELQVEIIASNTLEFDVERVRFKWTVESPFARRLKLN